MIEKVLEIKCPEERARRIVEIEEIYTHHKFPPAFRDNILNIITENEKNRNLETESLELKKFYKEYYRMLFHPLYMFKNFKITKDIQILKERYEAGEMGINIYLKKHNRLVRRWFINADDGTKVADFGRAPGLPKNFKKPALFSKNQEIYEVVQTDNGPSIDIRKDMNKNNIIIEPRLSKECPQCHEKFRTYNMKRIYCWSVCAYEAQQQRLVEKGHRGTRRKKVIKKQYEKTCPVCERTFKAKRTDAVTCSDTCRMARSREK